MISRALLIVLLLFFALSNALGALETVRWFDSELALHSAAELRYLLAFNAFWAFAFATALWAVTTSQRWAARGTIAVAMLYQAHLWLNRALLTRDTESMARLPFEAIISAATSLAVLILTMRQQAAARSSRGGA